MRIIKNEDKMKLYIRTQCRNRKENLSWRYADNGKPCTLETINGLIDEFNTALGIALSTFNECKIRLNFKMDAALESVTFKASKREAEKYCTTYNLEEVSSVTIILIQNK